MTFIDLLPSILGAFIGLLGFELTKRGFLRFRKPLITKWHWKDINEFPIPDFKSEQKKILVTDCKEVDDVFISCVNYNAEGKRIWDYDKKVITHWSYFPSPPIKE